MIAGEANQNRRTSPLPELWRKLVRTGLSSKAKRPPEISSGHHNLQLNYALAKHSQHGVSIPGFQDLLATQSQYGFPEACAQEGRGCREGAIGEDMPGFITPRPDHAPRLESETLGVCCRHCCATGTPGRPRLAKTGERLAAETTGPAQGQTLGEELALAGPHVHEQKTGARKTENAQPDPGRERRNRQRTHREQQGRPGRVQRPVTEGIDRRDTGHAAKLTCPGGRRNGEYAAACPLLA